MTLRACTRCGGTLTDVFRFCPACGVSSDGDFGWPLQVEEAPVPFEAESELTVPFPAEPGLTVPFPAESDIPVSFPIVERQRRQRARSAPRRAWREQAAHRASERLAAVAPAAGGVWRLVAASPRPFLRQVAAWTRRLLAGTGEAVRLLLEVVLVTAGSARDALRSTILLRKLHAQRAAVIYSTGCAALSGDDRRIRHARNELRMLDDLITAAAGHTRFPFAPETSASLAVGDVPTEETVRP